MDKLLLRPAEAAELLSISRSKTYELIATGVLPSVRVGGSVRVPVVQLRAWIDRQMTLEVDDPERHRREQKPVRATMPVDVHRR